MTKDVVDFLKAVEIDAQGREASANCICAITGLGKVRVKARPIWKVRQGIVVRQMLDLSFCLKFFGYVFGHDEQVLGLPIHPDRKSTRLNSSHANISYA